MHKSRGPGVRLLKLFYYSTSGLPEVPKQPQGEHAER